MKLPFRIFYLCLALFLTSILYLDRFFLKKNGGFSLHYITAPLPYNPQWATTVKPIPKDIIDQPFYYLGKGSQSFVFASQDNRYVIKFYRFPSHMRSIPWLKHPFSYTFDSKRTAIKEYNLKRFNLSFNSYFLAHTMLPKETHVLYAHLTPTTHLKQSVTIVDKLGIHYTLPLDNLGFIIQRKADKLFAKIQLAMDQNNEKQGRLIIDSLIYTIVARCQKGISDLDGMDRDNYGWIDNQATHIDVGRFVANSDISSPQQYQKEVARITQQLNEFLAERYPHLHTYYVAQIHNLFSE